jgi:hypothetical protein
MHHTPPTSSPYQPLALCVNVKPQPNTFLIPLNNAHVKPFPPSTLLALIVAHDQTPQPTPTLPTHFNIHLEPLAPLVNINLPFEG